MKYRTRTQKKILISDSDFHFLFLYFLLMIDAVMIGYTTLSINETAGVFSTILRVSAITVALYKIVIDGRHKVRELVFSLLFALVAGIAFIRSHYNHLLYFFVVGMTIWNVDVRKVVRFDFYVRLIMGALIIFGASTGVIENYITYRTGSTELRYSLGFSHPNGLASFVFVLVLEEAWLKKRHINWLYAVCIWFIAAILYIVTLNHSISILLFLFPFFLLFVRRDKKVTKRMKTAYAILPSLFVLFSIAAMMLCGQSDFFRMIDALVNGRFANAMRIYREYGVPILGQQVKLISVRMARENGTGIALLDVATLRLLIQAGPILLSAYIILYSVALWQISSRNDRYSLWLMMMFLLYGLCESGFNNIFMNFTLLMAWENWFRLDVFHLRNLYPTRRSR